MLHQPSTYYPRSVHVYLPVLTTTSSALGSEGRFHLCFKHVQRPELGLSNNRTQEVETLLSTNAYDNARKKKGMSTLTGRKTQYTYIENVSILISMSNCQCANKQQDLISDFQFSQLEQLQHLRMSWGVRPCWRRGSLHRGINLIRRFRSLKTITLEVKCLCSAAETISDGLVMCELRAIARIVLAEFELETQRDASWQAPQLRVLQVTQFTICQD
jgi:hypothetical protein